MEKLKTLKDLYIDINLKTASGKNRIPSIVLYEFEERLKAEAVKCAKYFWNQYQLAEERKDEFDELSSAYWKGRFDEVMERNNLTKEDLA